MTPRIRTDDFAYRIEGAPPIDHDTTSYACLMGLVPTSRPRDPRCVSSGFMQRVRSGMESFEAERTRLAGESDVAF
jgi:hypothetical protein